MLYDIYKEETRASGKMQMLCLLIFVICGSDFDSWPYEGSQQHAGAFKTNSDSLRRKEV